MIEEKKQRIERVNQNVALQGKISRMPGKRRLLRMPFKNAVRHGVSHQVLDVAKRLMKEYQTDLDYLRDK